AEPRAGFRHSRNTQVIPVASSIIDQEIVTAQRINTAVGRRVGKRAEDGVRTIIADQNQTQARGEDGSRSDVKRQRGGAGDVQVATYNRELIERCGIGNVDHKRTRTEKRSL